MQLICNMWQTLMTQVSPLALYIQGVCLVFVVVFFKFYLGLVKVVIVSQCALVCQHSQFKG